MLAHWAVASGDGGLWHHVNRGICLCNGNVKELSVRGCSRACTRAFPSICTKTVQVHYTGFMQPPFFVCLLSLCWFWISIFKKNKNKGQIQLFFSASECKPCSRSCEPPTAQLGVLPTSGKGSSSSLSPASVTEDVSLGSTSDDQVKINTLFERVLLVQT